MVEASKSVETMRVADSEVESKRGEDEEVLS